MTFLVVLICACLIVPSMLVFGQIGPATMAAVASKEPVAIIADFCHLREAHYKSLSTFATFGKGWMRRLDGIEAESKHLA